VHADIAAEAIGTKPEMLFEGSSLSEVRAWQKQFRTKLADLLGDIDPPGQWDTVEVSRQDFDDHLRLELLLTAKGLPHLPVYLLLPTDASPTKQVPGILCVHGHGNYGHHPVVGRTDKEGVAKAIAGANYDYGLKFVRRGYAVAAPCMIPFGDRVRRDSYGQQDPCAVTLVRMLALGQLPLGANLRDLRWAISLLQSRPEVSANRIGCAGLSYGGRMTMFTAAMDTRVKVAAPSGAFNLLQERITHRYSCGSQIVPGLLKYGDYSEVGSLIAPRPCVWEIGSRDGLVIAPQAEIFQQRIEQAYRAYGAMDQLHFDRFEGGHRWNGEVAYPLFEKTLA
jgi:dienelactone hydrolase